MLRDEQQKSLPHKIWWQNLAVQGEGTVKAKTPWQKYVWQVQGTERIVCLGIMTQWERGKRREVR